MFGFVCFFLFFWLVRSLVFCFGCFLIWVKTLCTFRVLGGLGGGNPGRLHNFVFFFHMFGLTKAFCGKYVD